jgi:hypothetical protein
LLEVGIEKVACLCGIISRKTRLSIDVAERRISPGGGRTVICKLSRLFRQVAPAFSGLRKKTRPWGMVLTTMAATGREKEETGSPSPFFVCLASIRPLHNLFAAAA